MSERRNARNGRTNGNGNGIVPPVEALEPVNPQPAVMPVAPAR